LPRREINWNHTPWQDDIFEDNEDMQALRTSIVIITHTLMVSMPFDVLFLLMIYRSAANELVVPWQNLAERAKSRVDLLNNATERERRIIDLQVLQPMYSRGRSKRKICDPQVLQPMYWL
jgi:hypothetical protein